MERVLSTSQERAKHGKHREYRWGLTWRMQGGNSKATRCQTISSSMMLAIMGMEFRERMEYEAQ